MFRKLINIFLVILLLLGLAFRFPGDDFVQGYSGDDFPGDEIVFVPDEVITLADSLEHAEYIAEAYDLELKSFANGVAVLLTDDPEQELIESDDFRAYGIPELSLNFVYELFDTTQSSDELQTAATGQWHRAEMDVNQAHSLGHTGSGVVVAVIDTGIDINHRAFSGKISARSYNSRTNNVGLAHVQEDHSSSHGTHISGVIAAARDTQSDVIGVAPGATIMTIKANNPESNVFSLDAIISGINYAVSNGAKVINLSLGRSVSGGESSAERIAIRNAVNNGVMVICAAGNEADSKVSYPAAYPEAIAVTATQQGFQFAGSYSNFGSQVDLSAPGSNIYSAVNGGGYGFMSGTSMAAGNVSGVAALVIAQSPSRTVQQVRDILTRTARDAGTPGFDIYFGHGIVNAHNAVRTPGTPPPPPPPPPQGDPLSQFIEGLYRSLLGRPSDPGGLNSWREVLLSGVTGMKVAEGFVFSPEFQNMQLTNEQYLRHMYRGMLGREADPAGLNSWVNVMDTYTDQREARLVIFNGFAYSTEFRAICANFGVRAT